MSGASQAVESDGGGGGKGGGGGGAGAHRSNSITSMGKSLSKTVAKGLGKSTHVSGMVEPRLLPACLVYADPWLQMVLVRVQTHTVRQAWLACSCCDLVDCTRMVSCDLPASFGRACF
jgi:hypothetical protein